MKIYFILNSIACKLHKPLNNTLLYSILLTFGSYADRDMLARLHATDAFNVKTVDQNEVLFI